MFCSIVIPVYNVEQYLRDCLDSVLAQSVSYFEIICVNDGSTDNSLSILEEYTSKFANYIIVNSANGGTAAARNIGIQKATGDYVLFLDSDDWLEPDALEVLNKRIEDKPVDILCFNGKLKYEADGGEKQDKGFVDSNLSGWEYYNKYALVPTLFHFVCVVLRVYRREFLLDNSLFFHKGVLHEDNLWIPLVLYRAKSVEIIPNSLYIYRIRSGSKMQTMNFRQIEDMIFISNTLLKFFEGVADNEKKVIYKIINRYYIESVLQTYFSQYKDRTDEVNSLIDWNKCDFTFLSLTDFFLSYLVRKKRFKLAQLFYTIKYTYYEKYRLKLRILYK